MLGDNLKSLAEELAQPTETKIISMVSAPKVEANTDDFKTDFDDDEPPFLENDVDDDDAQDQSSEVSAETSGKMIVQTSSVILTSVFTPIIKAKHKNTFSSDDWDKAEAAEMKAESDRTEEETKMVKKLERANRRFEERIQEIKFQEDEIQLLTDAMTSYCEETGFRLSPATLALTAAITSVGKRVVTVLT